MAERTVWIAEEDDFDYELGGFVCLGTFGASVQTEDELVEYVERLPLEAALAWGRERAARVLIRYYDSDYFSAGDEPVAGAPAWPPAVVPEFVRRRVPEDAWKDRMETDPPIAWRVEVRLEPPRLGRERDPADERLVADLAAQTSADDWDGHLIDELGRKIAEAGEGGAVYTEIAAYRLHYSVEASTPAQATDAVERRMVAPAGWMLSVVAEPA
jgi:hypothetical protein